MSSSCGHVLTLWLPYPPRFRGSAHSLWVQRLRLLCPPSLWDPFRHTHSLAPLLGAQRGKVEENTVLHLGNFSSTALVFKTTPQGSGAVQDDPGPPSDADRRTLFRQRHFLLFVEDCKAGDKKSQDANSQWVSSYVNTTRTIYSLCSLATITVFHEALLGVRWINAWRRRARQFAACQRRTLKLRWGPQRDSFTWPPLKQTFIALEYFHLLIIERTSFVTWDKLKWVLDGPFLKKSKFLFYDHVSSSSSGTE